MSTTDNDQIFSIAAVKALIEFKWPLTKRVVIKNLLLPYLCFLLVFGFYTIGDFMTSYEDYYKDNVDVDP